MSINKEDLRKPFCWMPVWVSYVMLIILFPALFVIFAVISMFTYDARVQDIFGEYKELFTE